MIDFDEELKQFEPSLEVDEAVENIYSQDLTDMTDIFKDMLQESRRVIR
jgi:hypothetical protein